MTCDIVVAPYDNAELAAGIRALRKRLNLTQRGLASALWVQQNTVNRWEMGRTVPTLRTLASLLRIAKSEVEIAPIRHALAKADINPSLLIPDSLAAEKMAIPSGCKDRSLLADSVRKFGSPLTAMAEAGPAPGAAADRSRPVGSGGDSALLSAAIRNLGESLALTQVEVSQFLFLLAISARAHGKQRVLSQALYEGGMQTHGEFDLASLLTTPGCGCGVSKDETDFAGTRGDD
jgi:transcriptional regulator with XRE-family HTH domain